ncbi:MAG TPA: HYR domain-containing protein [Candidatus Thermoplasmatota archaeon]|nr:HYR domain-containing protein [Candidatus Thermoplasmatota archaeon]
MRSKTAFVSVLVALTLLQGASPASAEDVTPPVIDPVADVAAEATSAAGAPVSFPVPALHDDTDGDGVATCDTESGALFPLGATTVACSGADAAGNAAEPVSFTVTVVDTTPPLLDAHADVAAEATGPDGASVAFDLPATHDLVDGDAVATCDVASGARLPLGATSVTCGGADAAGNAAVPVTFTIRVLDTTAPLVETHADMLVYTDDGLQKKKAVGYDVPVTNDAVLGTGTASCSPASGSIFPLGETTVSCYSIDPSGNVGRSSFQVRVVFDTVGDVSMSQSKYTSVDALTGAVHGVYHIASKSGAPLKNVDVRLHVLRSLAGVATAEDINANSDVDGNVHFAAGPTLSIPGGNYVVFASIRMRGYPPAADTATYRITTP